MRTPKNLTILKHHRSADVYIDGRYLHVVAKISLRSKRGREIARETAQTILQAVAASSVEDAIETVEKHGGTVSVKKYTEHTLTASQLQALSQYAEGTDDSAEILGSLLPSPRLANAAREYAYEVLADAHAEGWHSSSTMEGSRIEGS
jgi:hypothetical protein